MNTQDQQKKQKGLLDEWRNKSNKFDKSLRKSEVELKDQVAAEKEVRYGSIYYCFFCLEMFFTDRKQRRLS